MTDVIGFSAPQRTDVDRLAVRQAMYGMLSRACDDSGIPWSTCHHEDRGDGILLVIPPATPTRLAVHPLLRHLQAELCRHNRSAGEALRIRLRVALDVGPVTADPEGVSGAVIIRAARLLDASAFRRCLTHSPTDLGFITSHFVYDNIVKHDPDNIDPSEYRHLAVKEKEARLPAWIYLPRRPGGAAAEAGPRQGLGRGVLR